jgi:GAF domain-containing protein
LSAGDGQPEFVRLFHALNNQLGIILANAELLESRLEDATHRARAGQVASSALDAIGTAQKLKQLYAAPPVRQDPSV